MKVNDPNVVVREAKDFHGIDVSSSFDVYISQSDKEAVAVSAAESKWSENIIVEVKDGILHVRYDNHGLKWMKGDKKLRAYISFKTLDKLSVSGACDVFINGTVSVENLSIHQSGASDLKGKFEVSKKLSVDLSGASDLSITGKAGQLEIEASGASSFIGFDLVTDNCEARASGASDIRVTVNRELSAQASGASDIRFKGDAVMKDVHTSGASSVGRSHS